MRGAPLAGQGWRARGAVTMSSAQHADLTAQCFAGLIRGPKRAAAMCRVCQVTGTRPITCNKVSHSNIRQRRRFLPNLHTQRFWLESEGRWVTLKLSTRGLRTLEKQGLEKVVATLRAAGTHV